MSKSLHYIIIFIGLFLGTTKHIQAQDSYRSLIREGVALYQDSSFVDAEVAFRRAMQEEYTDTASFNIATTLHSQERYEDAIKDLNSIVKHTKNKELKSMAHYNIGNAYVRQQKLKEALEAYKDALRNDPTDQGARFNYLMVKRMIQQNPEQQQQNQDQQNEDQQDQEQNQDQDQQNPDQKDKGDQNEDQQNQDQKDQGDQGDEGDQDDQGEDQKDESDKGEDQKDESGNEDQDESKEDSDKPGDQEGEGQPEQREGEISREDALRLLEALQEQEEKTQEKVKAHKIKGSTQKNDKDW